MRLSRAVAAEVLAHAERALPREACGVLLSDAHGSLRVVELRNLDARPGRFLADPAGLHRALADGERRGEHLAACWHSHPGSSGLPGGADLSGAWKEVPTLVCTPSAVPRWRLWRFVDEVFSEVPLEHEDVPTPGSAARSPVPPSRPVAPCSP